MIRLVRDAEKLRDLVGVVIAHIEDGDFVSACEVLRALEADAELLAELLEIIIEAGEEQ